MTWAAISKCFRSECLCNLQMCEFDKQFLEQDDFLFDHSVCFYHHHMSLKAFQFFTYVAQIDH